MIILVVIGRLEELLSYSQDFPEQLAEFLQPHDHISWLHHVASQDYQEVKLSRHFFLTTTVTLFSDILI